MTTDLLDAEGWTRLLGSALREVAHLEMRDHYGLADEQAAFRTWQAGDTPDPAAERADWQDWLDLIGGIRARGAVVRRARIVSEPLSDYIRYEHEALTPWNIEAGEDVRWLPRRRASAIALPGNDFWLIDRHTVVWNHFTGAGDWAANEVTTDPDAVRLCGAAFDAVWAAAIPHSKYTPG